MRCGCPRCGAFMVQADGSQIRCVCPDCGYRCAACLGTDTVMSRAEIARIRESGEIPGFLLHSDEEDEDAGESLR